MAYTYNKRLREHFIIISMGSNRITVYTLIAQSMERMFVAFYGNASLINAPYQDFSLGIYLTNRASS